MYKEIAHMWEPLKPKEKEAVKYLLLTNLNIVIYAWVISISFGTWEVFERGGSLIIIAAIIMASLDFTNTLDKEKIIPVEKQGMLFQLHRVTKKLIEIQASEEAIKKAQNAYDHALENIEIITHKIDSRRSTLLWMEGIVLIIGTLIWGLSRPMLDYLYPIQPLCP